MKKLLALVLTLCMALSVVTIASAEGEKVGGWKIGYLASASADAGQALPTQESLKKTVTDLGCEVVEVIPASTSPDDLITSVENLINQGCDALCLYNQIHMNGLVATVIDMCEAAGVYVSFYNTEIKPDTDAYMAATESDYFVSAHYNDNVQAGYRATEKLAQAGAKKICVFGLPVSNLTGSNRYAGVEKAVADYGMEILVFNSDVSLLNAAGGTTVAESFLAAYPDMEGVVITGGTGLVMSGYAKVMAGKGIMTVGIDFSEGQTQYLESGVLNYITGGHIAGAAYAVIMLVNKLNGTPLVEGPAFIQDKFLEANNAEEAEKFDVCYFHGADLFSAEEVQNCVVAYNPAATMDTLNALIDNYTVEGLMAKHQ